MGMTSLIAIRKAARVESDFSEKSVKSAKLYIVVDDYPSVLYYI